MKNKEVLNMDYYSFVVYGTQQKYRNGLHANIDVLRGLENKYIVVYYDSYNTYIKDTYSDVPNLKSFDIGNDGNMFWRFMLRDLPMSKGDTFHSRDADSCITVRELKLIEQFKNSNRQVYCIRDHYHHNDAPYPIQGGLWGCKKDVYIKAKLSSLVPWWINNKQPFDYFSDMWFLNRYVYPFVKRFGVQYESTQSRWFGELITKDPHGDYMGRRIV